MFPPSLLEELPQGSCTLVAHAQDLAPTRFKAIEHWSNLHTSAKVRIRCSPHLKIQFTNSPRESFMKIDIHQASDI